MNLRELQTKLPWTIKYSRDFRANPQAHKDFAHALVHVTKACGKLAEMVDNWDHRRFHELEVQNYVADLVVCALRMANTHPGELSFDLEDAVIRRIETKNGVTLDVE